jgi:hypothetical protein
MRRRKDGENRDIVRREHGGSPAFGPVRGAFLRAGLGLAAAVNASACAQDGPPNVQVPMLSVNDPVFDAAVSSGADGGKDGGVVELEPSPPADAFACRRDVACLAVPVAAPSPGGGVAAAPTLKRSTAPGSAPSSTAAVLPSPFDHCPLTDDKGRHFSVRETRDARLNDAARCCYVAFVDCVRGSSR